MYHRCRIAVLFLSAFWLCPSPVFAPPADPGGKDLVKAEVHQVGRDSDDQYVVFSARQLDRQTSAHLDRPM